MLESVFSQVNIYNHIHERRFESKTCVKNTCSQPVCPAHEQTWTDEDGGAPYIFIAIDNE